MLRVGENPVNNQIAITAMFMIYLVAATKAQTVGLDRIWEMAVGAGVAVAVSSLVWPPHPLAESRRRVARLRRWLREDLEKLDSDELAHPGSVKKMPLRSSLSWCAKRSLEAVRDVFEARAGEAFAPLEPAPPDRFGPVCASIVVSE